jgi:hypothetical protein
MIFFLIYSGLTQACEDNFSRLERWQAKAENKADQKGTPRTLRKANLKMPRYNFRFDQSEVRVCSEVGFR